MANNSNRRSLFERLRTGLEEGIQFAQGKLSLRVTVIPDAPPRLLASDIIQLRHELKVSQTIFAQLLNVSAKTLQSWEQGTRRPSKASLRLLQLFKEKPQTILKIIGTTNSIPTSRRKPANHRSR
jgi:putative transcriptional regulator